MADSTGKHHQASAMPELRSDHVGSFLRPPGLLQARAAVSRGLLSLAELRNREDDAIKEILEVQRKAGLRVFTDGEYRRSDWCCVLANAVDGFVAGPPALPLKFFADTGTEVHLTGPPPPARFVVGDRLQQKGRLCQHEAQFLLANAPGIVKITIPAPSYIASRGFKPGVTDKVYATRDALLDAVSSIVHSEVKQLIAEGVRYIQLDNPHLPDYIDAKRCDTLRSLGIHPETALERDIHADNAVFEGLELRGVTTGMHICRGNAAGGLWHTSGGYDPIAKRVFQSANVQRFLLEYDSDRAGSFVPLAHMPREKVAVLGLVTTKSGQCEPVELLQRRLAEAAAFLPTSQLALSPQCGFASVVEGNPLSWVEQQRKLELIVSVARQVWP